jgi:hypothetical protein
MFYVRPDLAYSIVQDLYILSCFLPIFSVNYLGKTLEDFSWNCGLGYLCFSYISFYLNFGGVSYIETLLFLFLRTESFIIMS